MTFKTHQAMNKGMSILIASLLLGFLACFLAGCWALITWDRYWQQKFMAYFSQVQNCKTIEQLDHLLGAPGLTLSSHESGYIEAMGYNVKRDGPLEEGTVNVYPVTHYGSCKHIFVLFQNNSNSTNIVKVTWGCP